MSNKFQALGKLKNVSESAEFNGVVKTQQVKEFKDNKPKLFSRLLTLQLSLHEGNGRKPDGRLKSKNLFDFLYPKSIAKCHNCKKATDWGQERGRYREFCSITCVNSSKDIVTRRRKTTLERFGVEDANLAECVRKKKKETFLKNYGVDNPSKADSVKAKKSATMQQNFGADHWTKVQPSHFSTDNPMKYESTKNKIRDTCLLKYGFDSATKSQVVQAKIKATNIARYGLPNIGHIPKMYSRKKYVDKFGTKHIVQGYEPQAIEWICKKQGVIRVVSGAKQVPAVKYRVNNNPHSYYPDLLVYTKKQRDLIEVKSLFTLRLSVDILHAKFEAAAKYMEKRGGCFWLVVVDEKRIIRFKNPNIHKVLKKLGLTEL